MTPVGGSASSGDDFACQRRKCQRVARNSLTGTGSAARQYSGRVCATGRRGFVSTQSASASTDLGHKWGAASPDGHVRIHWAAMQLPLRLIDYVLAHELAHVHEPHHGPDFWQLVSRVMPDYEERKNELARRGPSLWFGRTIMTTPCSPALDSLKGILSIVAELEN